MSFWKRVAVSARVNPSSLMYSLPIRRLKEILSHVFPDLTLVSAEELPSTQLPRLYCLTMSDGQKLVLTFSPSLSVRLLRHEALMLSAEAALVKFIAGMDEETGPDSSLQTQTERPPRSELYELIPKLLKHSSSNREMAYPYSIFETIPGAPLSTLSIYLSLPERRLVDKQVGSMARRLASLTSPSGAFGPVSRVLPDVLPPTATALETQGSSTWAEAFHSLLEGVLRDGEDMAVLLPYDTIRAHYQQLSWCLGAVTVPRLLVLDAGSETNVMIERGSGEGTSAVPNGNPRLTGLRSWSQGVFGDPLISSCFEDPSEGFWEGWQEGSEEIIDDTDTTEARLLLYKYFRAAVSIVTEYYRPRADSSRKELEGRRRLTSALAEMDKGSGALKRVRSVSTEEESSKRQKAGEI
jgi:hypothetical protein